MKDYVKLTFGLVIAFLVPGATLTAGVAGLIPRLYERLSGPATTWSVLLAVCWVCGGGAFIAGLRALSLDRLIVRCTGVSRPENMGRLGSEETKLKAFEGSVEAFWHFYSFFGGMAVVSPLAIGVLALAGRDPFPSLSFRFTVCAGTLIEIVLVLSAAQSWVFYQNTAKDILNGERMAPSSETTAEAQEVGKKAGGQKSAEGCEEEDDEAESGQEDGKEAGGEEGVEPIKPESPW